MGGANFVVARASSSPGRRAWEGPLLVALVAICACGDPRIGDGWIEDRTAGGAALQLGEFTVSWAGSPEGAALRIARGEKIEWESIPGRAFVSAALGEEEVNESRGLFTVADRLAWQCEGQQVDAVVETAGGIEISGTLRCRGGEVPYRLALALRSPRQVAFDLVVDGALTNRTALVYRSREAERFFGFGEQFSHFDLKGARVPILVTEQGVGRGSFPITIGANVAAGAGGDWHTTYAALPHYVTSDLRSLYLENGEYALFDLRDGDRVAVQVFAHSVRGAIVSGDTPLELIAEYTSFAGRMRALPDWILSGAVIGVQGGTARVRELRDRLEASGAPLAAFWIQDWVGQRITSFGKQLWWNWELDQDRYPGWAALVAENRARGIRTMTYVNPFLAPVAGLKPNARRDLFAEAEAAGHLVRRADGTTYLQRNTDFSAGLVDLTSPAARDWFRQVLADEVIGAGADGWMADFGEALPFDAVLAAGEGAREHNPYPERWASLNREAIDATGRGDQMAFFMRSAFTRSPGLSTLFWEGDQLVSWDEHDGIKSAVTGLLSGGVSGLALNHSDIGGYTAIENPLQSAVRSQELLMRWAELSAFTTVFRTHEGNRPDDNHQIDSAPETLAHFARMAKLYRAWAPYRRALVDEAAATGAPVVRHPFLHYSRDAGARAIRFEEFLVGTELLVVPVLDPGRVTARAYLPPGEWVHLWTGERHGDAARGVWEDVPAPLGRPAVFYRRGSSVGEDLRAQMFSDGLLP